MNRSSVAAAVTFLAVLSAGTAFAQPQTVAFSARLSDNLGNPVTGQHALAFRLFDAATGGTQAWTESYANAVFASDGTITTDLGSVTPLTGVFNGATLFLEVTVDGTTLSPRMKVQSVPYALYAGTADRVGSLLATDIQRRVTGTCAGGAIQSVNADGTVVCYAAPDAGSGAPSSVNIAPALAGVYPDGPKLDGDWIRINGGGPGGAMLAGSGAAGTFDQTGVLYPTVIKVGGTYRMYYAGLNAGGAQAGIGLATSTDGVTWTRAQSTPVIGLTSGNFDSTQVGGTGVVYDNGTYYVFYHGFNGTNWRLGLATSTDGVTFQKSGSNPILNLAGGWDSTHLHTPSVIKEGNNWTMYYMGHNGTNWAGVGVATSNNGTSWTKFAGNPVIRGGQGWDNNDLGMPVATKIGPVTYVHYSGSNGNWRTGLAYSLDGRLFTKAPYNPTLQLIPGTLQSTHVHQGQIVFDGDKARYWYSAHDGTTWRIVGAVQHLAPR